MLLGRTLAVPNRAKQAKAKAKTRVKGFLGQSILWSSIDSRTPI
jgi:hypothetical protein